MKRIRDLLAGKGGEICSVSPAATVHEAVKLLAEKNIGALVVMEGESLAGIVSERDYLRKIALGQSDSSGITVAEIMTSPVACARPEQSVEECMAMMTDKRIRHLPVVENDMVIGVISIGDLVKAIIAEQQFIIEQLEHYIAG
ncbi:MAG: CBS domain-containing protein [Gammaproteobacteria bacterium]|nr:CBS domain-containing protein [Gammaproteobacteria bacterium]